MRVNGSMGAGGTCDRDGDEGDYRQDDWIMSVNHYNYPLRHLPQKHTSHIIHPQGFPREKHIVRDHQRIKQLIYQEVVPRGRHIPRPPADDNRHESLGGSQRDRRRECNPRKHRRETAEVREPSTPAPTGQNGREMVLSTRGGIDAGQLRQCDSRSHHGDCHGYNPIQQRGSATRLDGDRETGSDGHPAVGDVISYCDDAEDTELAP